MLTISTENRVRGWLAVGVMMISTAWASAADLAGPWPQWRGPNRDDISTEKGLMQQWPSSGPKLLWTLKDTGAGFSGPAIVGDTLYIMGLREEKEHVIAVDVASGNERWAVPFANAYTNGYGDGPRGTPTVDGDFLYVLSGNGTLACLARADGKVVWSKSCVKDFGGQLEGWGYTESPLIDGDRVCVCPGGKKFLVGLNKSTGEEILKSKGITDGHQYASLIVATVGDVKMYVTQTQKGLIGISAESGELLWRNASISRRVAVVPTPIFSDDLVYVSAGYGAGCECVKLTANGGKITAKEVYNNKAMANHHGGVLLKDGYLYGHSDLRTSDHPAGWKCQNLKSGKTVWTERRAVEKGSIAFADGRIYCYGEDTGKVVLAEASPKGWKEHGSFKIPQETQMERKRGKIWTHPVIADGKLYLRDQDLLFCYDVKAK